MQTWVDRDGIMHHQRKGRDGNILRWFNLGDWVAPGVLPPADLVHTFYFWRCADITAKTAAILGKTREARWYATLAENTRKAFHKSFFYTEKGTYGAGGGNIFALVMGVPENQYSKVIGALKSDIAANNGHLDTGIFGTQFFFETLSEHGMHDLAWDAMTKTEEPGYGRWIELGATTMWEHWDTGGSHNHPMFGGGISWFYRNLAGMNANPEEPGYKHIIFRPQPVGDLTFARYFNNTSYGEAGIHWKKEENQFVMEVTVPVGSYATVYVPAAENATILESGKPIANQPYVQKMGWGDGYHIFRVENGNYSFNAR
jgi:alpha-L-rhamnosidase